MYNPNLQIKDLKNTWLVFKKVKKQNFYYRGASYSQTHSNPNKAQTFGTKEGAQDEAKLLNKNRKSYKFRVESADKHFVSNWRIGFDNWNKRVYIKNEPIAFHRVAKYQTPVSQTLNDKKAPVIKELDNLLAKAVQERDVIDRRFKAELEAIEKRREESIKNQAELAAQLLMAKAWVDNTNLDTEYVEKFQSETDKKAYILFGKKEHAT